jgi:large subunit ribosomal protein L18
MVNKKEARKKRHLRIRKKIVGVATRPRLVIFKSLRYFEAQVINDEEPSKSFTITSLKSKIISKEKALNQLNKDTSEEIKTENEKHLAARIFGEQLASQILSKKINCLVFDRAGYKYHGRIRTIVETLRKQGIVI